jgi:hypothetical protein
MKCATSRSTLALLRRHFESLIEDFFMITFFLVVSESCPSKSFSFACAGRAIPGSTGGYLANITLGNDLGYRLPVLAFFELKPLEPTDSRSRSALRPSAVT